MKFKGDGLVMKLSKIRAIIITLKYLVTKMVSNTTEQSCLNFRLFAQSLFDVFLHFF